MPYITKEQRDTLSNPTAVPVDTGELNYRVTKEVDRFLVNYGTHYATINAVIGVLECVKLELYRRIAAPYEDSKLQKNGDVYTRPRHRSHG